MRKKLLTIMFTVLITVISLANNGYAMFVDDYKFGDLVNLGSDINTEYYEGQPSFTADGNTIFFMSNRPGGYGGYDIYTAEKVDGVWQPAVNLGETVNSANLEHTPVISPDGNKLFFTLETSGGYTRVWMTEKVGDEWQNPVILPGIVNLSWANNNTQFISHDGKWLYFSCWVGYGNWNIYRLDLTTGDFSVRETLPGPINTGNRDFGLYQTMDERFFVVYTDNGGWHVQAWELVDGVYQNGGSLTEPFWNRFTLAENESLLYTHRNLVGGFGGEDIYVAPRIGDCSQFVISSVSGAEQVINPLPLAGQEITIDVGVTGSSLPEEISWTIFADGQPAGEGVGLVDGVKWDGRNVNGEIVPGTYDLVVSVTTHDGCAAEQNITAVLEMTDDCKLRVTFP